MSLPVGAKFLSYAYESDLLGSDGSTNLIGAVRARIIPSSLDVGDSPNDPATGDVTLPIPLIISKKKRGLYPRHVILGVTDTGAGSPTTITKIAILTTDVANVILQLGSITEPGAFTYEDYSGTIRLVGFAQEFYFRVFEQVESSAPTLLAARAAKAELDREKVIPEKDIRDYEKLYKKRLRELNDAYKRQEELPDYSVDDDL